MSAAQKGPRKQQEPPPISYRRILWGIRKNQVQLEKLVEVILRNLNKALPLAIEEQQRLAKQQRNPAADWTAKEIQCLQQELDILERLMADLELCQKNWPVPENRAEKKPVRKKTSSKADTQTKSTILVIDDDKITAKSLQHFLRQKSYQVITIPSAEKGLETAQTENPDLILLDIMMPGMNGYQFLSILKKDKSTTHIPVIILSSLSREADILEGLDKGAHDYVIKPYSPQVLMSKVTKLLAR